MSATMARQGGWVKLEQSNMHLALNMAKMAKGGFLRTAVEKMKDCSRTLEPKSRIRRCGQLTFVGIEQ